MRSRALLPLLCLLASGAALRWPPMTTRSAPIPSPRRACPRDVSRAPSCGRARPSRTRSGSTGSSVPAQYDASKPAALMVFQDGHKYVNTEEEYRVPVVFDNLIAKGQMPVTIALFVNPGHNSEQFPDRWRESNRANEYDALGDQYAQFLIDELIPRSRRNARSRRIPKGTSHLAARAPAASAPSPRPGSGRTTSARSSATSAAS